MRDEIECNHITLRSIETSLYTPHRRKDKIQTISHLSLVDVSAKHCMIIVNHLVLVGNPSLGLSVKISIFTFSFVRF